MTLLQIKSLSLAAVIALGGAQMTAAQDMQPFGTEHDAAYAKQIWAVMQEQRLAGTNAIYTLPYEGTDPHGMQLETFFSTATINGHTGDLVIKRNYGPEGVEPEEVMANPTKHLGAITVMFRREAGFDEDNKNWFWVKFLPDGTLDKNPKGMQLAGKIAKGADVGCIACHTAADGEDYVFTSNAYE